MAFNCTLCGADITIHDDGLGHCSGCGMTYTLTALRAMAAGSMPDTSQGVSAPAARTVNPVNTAALDRDMLVAYLEDIRWLETVINEQDKEIGYLQAAPQKLLNKLAADKANVQCPAEPGYPLIDEPGYGLYEEWLFYSFPNRLPDVMNNQANRLFKDLGNIEQTGLYKGYPITEYYLENRMPFSTPQRLNLYTTAQLQANYGAWFIQGNSVYLHITYYDEQRGYQEYIQRSLDEFYRTTPKPDPSDPEAVQSYNNWLNMTQILGSRKRIELYMEWVRAYDNDVANYNNYLGNLEYNCSENINEAEQRLAVVTADRNAAAELLEQAYSENIIPMQMRNIWGAYYLFDYLSTSQQSLSEALFQFNLEQIKQRLDKIISQQGTQILEQRQSNSLLNKILGVNIVIAQNTDAIAANTAATAVNTAATAANTAATAQNTAATAAYAAEVAANTGAIAANTASIADSAQATAANTGSIAVSSARTARSAAAIASNADAMRASLAKMQLSAAQSERYQRQIAVNSEITAHSANYLANMKHREFFN